MLESERQDPPDRVEPESEEAELNRRFIVGPETEELWVDKFQLAELPVLFPNRPDPLSPHVAVLLDPFELVEFEKYPGLGALPYSRKLLLDPLPVPFPDELEDELHQAIITEK